MKKTLIASMVTGVALTLSGIAMAGGPHFKHMGGPAGEAGARGPHVMFEHTISHMTEQLALTDEQTQATKKLHEGAKAKMAPLMEQHHQQMEAVHSLLDSGTASATEIGEKMIAAHETGNQLRAVHAELRESFAALLTAEQRAKLEELEANKPRHRRMFMHF